MKTYFNLLFLIIVFFQKENIGDKHLIANYTYSIKLESAPSVTVINSTLLANNNASIYEMDFMNNSSFIEEDTGNKGAIFSIKAKNNPVIYKDYSEKSIYSIERILMKPNLVKDSMDIFVWNLQLDSKMILGYNCQKATTYFRGRNYTAYFTPEIPYQIGPWKFTGLPGLIMEVKSDDNVFEIKINSLKITNKKVDIKNPYAKKYKKSITWNQFLKKYIKKYNELTHYRSPNGGTMSIPKKNIETYIE